MQDDAVLFDNDIASALSVAYVQAVAAVAGYACDTPPGPDRDSIDLQVAASGSMRPKLDLQLKASTRLAGDEAAFQYPLKLKNYNDLRIETQTPRLLVVLDLPSDMASWLEISPTELAIHRAAYWRSLRGEPDPPNLTSVRDDFHTESEYI